MKKILCLILSVLVVFLLSSCSEDKEDENLTGAADASSDDATVDGNSADRGEVPTHIQNAVNSEESSSGTDETGNVSSDSGVLTLSSASSEVAAGDAVTVRLNFSGCSYVASLDVFVEADRGLTYDSSDMLPVSDFSMEFSQAVQDGCSVSRIAGFTMYTKDFDDTDICDITYKIPASAKSGDKFTVRITPYDIQVGTDKDGATLLRITDDVAVNQIEFTVK